MTSKNLAITSGGSTELQKICSRCHEPTEKLCTGCRKVRYCGPECQRSSWPEHIFECNPRRPINTADHLALAVYKNLLPEDPQACIDYGFERASTPRNRSYLLGLYIGLIERMGIKPITIHRWRTNGILVQEVKRAYEAMPVGSRGGYYPWFLENQHILDPLNDEGPPLMNLDQGFKRAWQLAGGSATDSLDRIQEAISSFDEERQTCHQLYTILLAQWHPGPSLPDLYIKFGFCVCTEESELRLGALYQSLITRCTFDEFVAASEDWKIFQLFLKYELSEVQSIPYLKDLLDDSLNLSVWDLKAYVLSQDESARVVPAVSVDYGYMNCKNATERKELTRVYAKVLAGSTDAAISLHKAAVAGRLFEHVSMAVKLKKGEKKIFARLMKNPYPLPDL